MDCVDDMVANTFRMDVLINDDSMKRIFQLEIRTHFGHAVRELVVEVIMTLQEEYQYA